MSLELKREKTVGLKPVMAVGKVAKAYILVPVYL